jgi:hypothetical protein
VTEDIKASHPRPFPFEYRELLQDETPREFRFIRPHLGKVDATEEYWRSLASKATEFFADERDIFAHSGPSVCAHVCSC